MGEGFALSHYSPWVPHPFAAAHPHQNSLNVASSCIKDIKRRSEVVEVFSRPKAFEELLYLVSQSETSGMQRKPYQTSFSARGTLYKKE
ncbi:hypothetical protein ACP6EK_05115 [Candidatus Caldatribacterium sp. SIUC1]|uniref:hypothetical protein n=1 Tax=Candidatus Caldatribacterium sp. SIUC1 TaxID=3418365 RepID=UPI003F68E41F